MMEVDGMTGELDVSALPEATGVYAIYDDKSVLMYIGLSRQIRQSVANHAKSIGALEAPSLITSVRVAAVPGAGKELLKELWQQWIKEHMDDGGDIPQGNLPQDAPGADPRWRTQSSAQANAPLKLAPPSGIYNMDEALEAVRKAVTKHPVIIFMKGTPGMPQCGFSARSVGILREIGVPFDAVNILDGAANPMIRDAVKQYSNWPTIPQLFLGGKLIGGADIIGQMYENGQLEPAIRRAVAGEADDGSSGSSSKAGSSVRLGEIGLVNDARRPTASQLSATLAKSFALEGLWILDESASHEGDAGAMEMGLSGESHFRVEVVSPNFKGLSSLERQQQVFAALSGVMPRIHALSLVTLTPEELA